MIAKEVHIYITKDTYFDDGPVGSIVYKNKFQKTLKKLHLEDGAPSVHAVEVLGKNKANGVTAGEWYEYRIEKNKNSSGFPLKETRNYSSVEELEVDLQKHIVELQGQGKLPKKVKIKTYNLENITYSGLVRGISTMEGRFIHPEYVFGKKQHLYSFVFGRYMSKSRLMLRFK